jgi:hypothetical protein
MTARVGKGVQHDIHFSSGSVPFSAESAPPFSHENVSVILQDSPLVVSDNV